MAYETVQYFDSIFVLESLDQGRTGTELFDDVLLHAPRQVPGIQTALRQVHTRDAFLAALARLSLEVRAQGLAPIVHIEAHGAEEGIELASGELCTWEEMAPIFADINEHCRMNLLVVSAACFGLHLSKILRPTDRAPIWGVIGPRTEVRAGSLSTAMKAYYRTLLGTLDATKALYAANEGRPIPEWTLSLTNAELLFCHVFRRYMSELGSVPASTDRVNTIVAAVVRAQGLTVVQSAVLRAQVEQHLIDHEHWYDMFRRRFLFLDMFPENAIRFPESFAECMRVAT